MTPPANAIEIEIGGEDYVFVLTNTEYNKFMNEFGVDRVRASTNLLVSCAASREQKDKLKAMTEQHGIAAVFMEVAMLLVEDFTPVVEVKLKKSMKPLIA